MGVFLLYAFKYVAIFAGLKGFGGDEQVTSEYRDKTWSLILIFHSFHSDI